MSIIGFTNFELRYNYLKFNRYVCKRYERTVVAACFIFIVGVVGVLCGLSTMSSGVGIYLSIIGVGSVVVGVVLCLCGHFSRPKHYRLLRWLFKYKNDFVQMAEYKGSVMLYARDNNDVMLSKVSLCSLDKSRMCLIQRCYDAETVLDLTTKTLDIYYS